MKKRGFGAGKWNGVGGKLEPGESIEDALVREAIEEVSMKPLTWHKKAELDFVQNSDSNPWHMYVHAYFCTEWEGEPTESEEMRPTWYALTDIPYEKMWEDDQYWLPRVLAGETLQGRFTFDGSDKLIEHALSEVKF